MRTMVTILFVAFGLWIIGPSVQAGAQKETPSALQADPEGWLDLTADGLKHWKRVSIPPKSKLKDGNPWSFDAKTGTIHCKGVGYHEMLLYDREISDGIFHVEWRFKKVEGKRGYNSGVYARNSADGKIWHQAQVGSKNVGHFFGSTPTDGKFKRFRSEKFKGPQRGKEAGEWNTYEITCKGNTMSLWVNGATTTVWKDCEVLSGFVGMEAERWEIEFKNVKFKPMESEVQETGWLDLMPGGDIQWKRVPMFPDKKLSKRNPWRMNKETNILECDGKDIKEMYLIDRKFKDGIYHLEFRFRPVEGKKEGYNSGTFLRCGPNGKLWIQAQTAMSPKHPLVGDLFGDVLQGDKVVRVLNKGTGNKHVKPVGEWNVFDIHCDGKNIKTVLNGKTVCEMNDCPMLEGYFGLQAEYYFIEFRNIRFLEK